MDNSSRQSKGASHPQFSLLVYLAATVAAIVWPRLAPDAGLLTWFGFGAVAILWVPFALWATADGVLLVAPHLTTISASEAQRLAAARLVSGIRFLARCSIWLIPVIAFLGANPLAWWDRATGSAPSLLLTVLGVAFFVIAIPQFSKNLDRLNPTKRAPKPLPVSGCPGRGGPGGSPARAAASDSADLVSDLTSQLQRALLAALRFGALWALWLIRSAVRWTRFGVAALDPRLGSDPLLTLNLTTASVASARAAGGPANYAAGAAAGATAALAGTGSLLTRTLLFLRGSAASNLDRPTIYGQAAIWTEKAAEKGAEVETYRELLKTSRWHRNDPEAIELKEIGNAILEAAHTDAIQHGNSAALRGGAGGAGGGGGGGRFGGEEGEAPTPAVGPGLKPTVGKKLIIKRAWARPEYFAYILSTAPVVANDILNRLTTANLAANVSAHSRFTRFQVLAWLHTEHDDRDTHTEVLVDDPARAGVVGTFMLFDRGAARSATSPAAATFGANGADEDEDDGDDDNSPFSRSPF
jgi:hypothetical protein